MNGKAKYTDCFPTGKNFFVAIFSLDFYNFRKKKWIKKFLVAKIYPSNESENRMDWM